MIRITKGDAPEPLVRLGVRAANQHKIAYDADPDAYLSGAKKLEIRSSIYGHRAVRAALARTHHGKCAFCEVLIPLPYADAHVEHWRPKGSVKQAKDTPDLFPGYYWLAYDWDNLLLSCQFCNRSNKRTYFPLEDPSTRALNHHQSVATEAPQILKPDGPEDPALHIGFDDELPIGLTEIGWKTIKILGLDRLEHEPRDALLVKLRKAFADVVQYNDDPHPAARAAVAEGRDLYATAPLPSSPFSAMAAAFIAKNPLPAPPEPLL